MTRLIAISNRVQAARDGESSSRGGLAVALAAALTESNGIWFGWSGQQTDEFTGQITFRREGGVATATIDLEAQDVDEYYNGFANRTLWPLFHFRLDLTEIARDFAGGYARVNDRFASTVAPLIEPDDMIWVHDYHLMPLGQLLRGRGFANRMGFFLHIPWPPASLMMSLPNHRELVTSLLSYDVVGFHTDEWRDSFVDYITTHLGAQVDGELVHLGDRTARLLICPIGLDTTEFMAAEHSDAARNAEARLITSAVGRAVIVGVDRLDYSKGLQERFVAYEQLLNTRPELREKVFMLQIAPPSRGDVPSYQQIRAELNSLSGGINGEFASIDWVPIRYVNQGYLRDELFGIYRASRVGLVTPLRDGMNLVAKEYVAAQDPEDPGVLVLSRFAGAAAQLDAALIVNPHSSEDIADAIARALAMPLPERKSRHAAMLQSVTREDVHWWSRRFIAALATAQTDQGRPQLTLATGTSQQLVDGCPGPSRYEFRCWPQSLAGHVPSSQRMTPVPVEARTDIYCVRPGDTRMLCKLRDRERLQIKLMLSRADVLERWQLVLDSDFPLSARTRANCARMLHVEPKALAVANAARFLESIEAQPQIRRIDMHKSRRQFVAQGLKTELVQAVAAGEPRLTVALEGDDRFAVKREVEDAGLSAFPNQSYATWLDRLAAD